jgi:hypothetical protein
MNFEAAAQPVILLGMHRSGTAMVARLLDHLGLFQGNELQEDHESVWFLEINDVLLERVNAAWDNPGPVKALLANPAAFELTARCLAADLSSKLSRKFLGMRRALEFGSLPKYNRPWGWKDPRTIFTLPLWLRLFPQAKLVYIVRNGVDVAKSLTAREKRELERRIEEFEGKHPIGNRSKLQRAGFKGSARCLTLQGGFSLWEEYVAEAERALAEAPNPRTTIQYESFLADPAGQLPELARFCGIDSGEDAVRKAIERVRVNPARANAFASDPAVATFHENVRASRWMQHYGYGG